ncbi:hypothetical protein KRMM14A1259_18630 [Krasilnikovia sp. MM14-A1259]
MTSEAKFNEDARFRWTKVAHGWISFALDGGSGQYRCTVSDASDVMAELLLAVARIVRGSLEEQVSFDHEPTEIRWTLRRATEKVSVSIESFERWGSNSGGHLKWLGNWSSTSDFGQEFLVATESFLQDVGPDGYSSGWPSYSTPDHAIGDLKTSLNSAATFD